MITSLLAAGLCAELLAMAVLAIARSGGLWSRASLWTASGGAGLLASCGFLAALRHGEEAHPPALHLGYLLAFGHTLLLVDHLSGGFLALCGTLATVLLAVTAAGPRQPRMLALSSALVVFSLGVVITSGDTFSFLFGWELLTLAFFALSSMDRNQTGSIAAGWATVSLGKASGAALLIGFLLLDASTHHFALAAWHSVPGGTLRDVAWVLLIAGFGAKIGLVPFHVWMHRGYAAAPRSARALMAGVAVNAGFYGMWRSFSLLGPPAHWIAGLVVVLGGIGAITGMLQAAAQRDLARLVAYSSVENAGLITAAYGLALVGASYHQPLLVTVGLLAATLQVVTHAIAKSALYLGTDAIERDYGTTSLDKITGAIHVAPASTTAMLVGGFAMAGLPPTIGFVSEWFILEAFLQQFRVHGLAIHLAMAVGGALVALTAGLAAFTFTRLLGLTLLGRRRPGAELATVAGRRRRDRQVRAGASAGLLVGLVGMAVVSPWEIRFLADALSPVTPRSSTRLALASPWVLHPVYAGFSILSPSWFALALVVGFAGVALLTWVLSGGRVLRVRRVPAWRSASDPVELSTRYSSTGFTGVLRNVLANVLRTRRSLTPSTLASSTASDEATATRASYASAVEDVTETFGYRPALRSLGWLARWASRLQSGNLASYLAAMLLVAIALLAVVAGLH